MENSFISVLNTSTVVVSPNKMPGTNIVVRKKKWNANDMAALINHWINNVEQNGINIRGGC